MSKGIIIKLSTLIVLANLTNSFGFLVRMKSLACSGSLAISTKNWLVIVLHVEKCIQALVRLFLFISSGLSSKTLGIVKPLPWWTARILKCCNVRISILADISIDNLKRRL